MMDSMRQNRLVMELQRRVLPWLDSLRKQNRKAWPLEPGKYRVTDRHGSVAVCTLTSSDLVGQIEGPGVAIVGRVYTPNLGLEKIIRNIRANPEIRFLLLCGKESPVFQAGQALVSLFANGVDESLRIIGATGLMPELTGLSVAEIDSFRRQVSLVNLIGQTSPDLIMAKAAECSAANPGPYHDAVQAPQADPAPQMLLPGGRRQPIDYDRMGFFVIATDPDAGQIEVQHFTAERRVAHAIRGKSAEAIWLSLLEAGLVTQLSHAAYLGAELSKAETSLRLRLHYEQDQPLRLPVHDAAD